MNAVIIIHWSNPPLVHFMLAVNNAKGTKTTLERYPVDWLNWVVLQSEPIKKQQDGQPFHLFSSLQYLSQLLLQSPSQNYQYF